MPSPLLQYAREKNRYAQQEAAAARARQYGKDFAQWRLKKMEEVKRREQQVNILLEQYKAVRGNPKMQVQVLKDLGKAAHLDTSGLQSMAQEKAQDMAVYWDAMSKLHSKKGMDENQIAAIKNLTAEVRAKWGLPVPNVPVKVPGLGEISLPAKDAANTAINVQKNALEQQRVGLEQQKVDLQSTAAKAKGKADTQIVLGKALDNLRKIIEPLKGNLPPGLQILVAGDLNAIKEMDKPLLQEISQLPPDLVRPVLKQYNTVRELLGFGGMSLDQLKNGSIDGPLTAKSAQDNHINSFLDSILKGTMQ